MKTESPFVCCRGDKRLSYKIFIKHTNGVTNNVNQYTKIKPTYGRNWDSKKSIKKQNNNNVGSPRVVNILLLLLYYNWPSNFPVFKWVNSSNLNYVDCYSPGVKQL